MVPSQAAVATFTQHQQKTGELCSKKQRVFEVQQPITGSEKVFILQYPNIS
jgi:hypothetical protein